MSNIVENWDDKAFVLEKVEKTNEFLLEFASERLKDDPEVMLVAVSNNGYNLKFASDRLRDNEAIVLAAVNSNGMSLCLVSNRLRDNEEIVLTAVSQNGYSLKHASDRIKNNEDIVLTAVSQNSYALNHASDRLKGDIDFCLQCANHNENIDFNDIFLMGEAAELFAHYENYLPAIEIFWQGVKQQQQDNEALLAKLKNTPLSISNSQLFKRRLYV